MQEGEEAPGLSEQCPVSGVQHHSIFPKSTGAVNQPVEAVNKDALCLRPAHSGPDNEVQPRGCEPGQGSALCWCANANANAFKAFINTFNHLFIRSASNVGEAGFP